MGNNTSTEEAIGGSFLVGVGTVLACALPGVGTVIGGPMIAIGGSVLSGHEVNSPVGGVTYDEHRGIQCHVGNGVDPRPKQQTVTTTVPRLSTPISSDWSRAMEEWRKSADSNDAWTRRWTSTNSNVTFMAASQFYVSQFCDKDLIPAIQKMSSKCAEAGTNVSDVQKQNRDRLGSAIVHFARSYVFAAASASAFFDIGSEMQSIDPRVHDFNMDAARTSLSSFVGEVKLAFRDLDATQMPNFQVVQNMSDELDREFGCYLTGKRTLTEKLEALEARAKQFSDDNAVSTFTHKLYKVLKKLSPAS